jgi:uncharacterized membrane protein YvbJ
MLDKRTAITLAVFEALCLLLIVLALTGHLHSSPNP